MTSLVIDLHASKDRDCILHPFSSLKRNFPEPRTTDARIARHLKTADCIPTCDTRRSLFAEAFSFGLKRPAARLMDDLEGASAQ